MKWIKFTDCERFDASLGVKLFLHFSRFKHKSIWFIASYVGLFFAITATAIVVTQTDAQSNVGLIFFLWRQQNSIFRRHRSMITQQLFFVCTWNVFVKIVYDSKSDEKLSWKKKKKCYQLIKSIRASFCGLFLMKWVNWTARDEKTRNRLLVI